jgi:hypothetical protein
MNVRSAGCGVPSEAPPLTTEVRAGLVCWAGVMLLAWLHR